MNQTIRETTSGVHCYRILTKSCSLSLALRLAWMTDLLVPSKKAAIFFLRLCLVGLFPEDTSVSMNPNCSIAAEDQRKHGNE